MRLGFAILALTAFVGCATNKVAQAAAPTNAHNIKSVRLGQTMSEVHAIMGKDPEIRTKRVASGVSQEEWSYVTDYENDVLTRITFTDQIASEISQQPWEGNYSTNTIQAGEDLRTATEKELSGQAAQKQAANIETLETLVRVGLSTSEVLRIAGQPTKRELSKVGTEIRSERWTYTKRDGHVVVIRFKYGKVSSING